MSQRLMQVKDLIEQERKFLKWLGFTDKMIDHRIQWIEGYCIYHRCKIEEGIEASRDRWDSSSPEHVERLIAATFR